MVDDNNAEVGVKDATVSAMNDYHSNIPGSSVFYDNFWTLDTKGSGWTRLVSASAPPFSAGDVIMWALDRVAGRIWYGRNGTWVYGGNPATGANPTFSAPTTALWYPSVYAEDGARFRIATTAADFKYPIPAGFKSYAAALGFSDGKCLP